MKTKMGIITLLVIILVSLVLLFKSYLFIEVSSYNSSFVTNSKICNNGSDYYYCNTKGQVKHLSDDKEELFYSESLVTSVACNSKYVFMSDHEGIVRVSVDNGSMFRYTAEHITELYADEEYLLYITGGAYNILDSDTMETVSIESFVESNEIIKDSDLFVLGKKERKIISQAVSVNLKDNNFIGDVVLKDKCLNFNANNIVNEKIRFIAERTDTTFDTTFAYFSGEPKYTAVGRIDYRHMLVLNDCLISVRSEYDQKSFLNKIYGNNKSYDPRDGLTRPEKDLSVHQYDTLCLYNLNTGESKEYNTGKGEKIVYVDNEKFITFCDKKYLVRSVDNYEITDEMPAHEIKRGGTYTFEQCGEYIFVFDGDSGELLNKIKI